MEKNIRENLKDIIDKATNNNLNEVFLENKEYEVTQSLFINKDLCIKSCNDSIDVKAHPVIYIKEGVQIFINSHSFFGGLLIKSYCSCNEKNKGNINFSCERVFASDYNMIVVSEDCVFENCSFISCNKEINNQFCGITCFSGNSSFTNCAFYYFGDCALSINKKAKAIVNRCDFIENANGIVIAERGSLSLEKSMIRKSSSYGIYGNTCSNITMDCCVILDSLYGVYTYGSFIGNDSSIINLYDSGIYFGKESSGYIKNFHIHEAKENGIYMEKTFDIAIENSFISCNKNGLKIYSQGRLSVKDNKIIGNESYGVYIDYCEYEVYESILNNNIFENKDNVYFDENALFEEDDEDDKWFEIYQDQFIDNGPGY